jgi:heat shock protein beta
MKPKQKQLYFLTGESASALKNSPFLERLTKRDYEVIFMTDPLDEYVMSNLNEFEGKKFMSASKEGLKFGDESEDHKAREKALEEEFKPLTDWLKTVYGDKVEKVVISNRVAKSPAVLVTSQWGWSANMERIMRAQTFSDAEKQSYMMSKKTMEINPRHPVIKTLKEKSAAGPDDDSVKDLANLMYDTALLSSGFTLGDLSDFSSRMARIMAQGLGVDPNAPIEEEPEPEPSKEDEDGEDKETATDSDSSSGEIKLEPVEEQATDSSTDSADSASSSSSDSKEEL